MRKYLLKRPAKIEQQKMTPGKIPSMIWVHGSPMKIHKCLIT